MEKNITLEQIDLIMQRANVSYSEAKEALEQSNGDTVEALLYLERAEKIKKTTSRNCSEDVKSFIGKLNCTRFILKKQQHTYVDVPLTVAIIAIITCFHVSVIALIVAIATGVKIDIKGENDIASKLSSGIDSFQK